MSLKVLIRVYSSDIYYLLMHASFDGICHVSFDLDLSRFSRFSLIFLIVFVPVLLR